MTAPRRGGPSWLPLAGAGALVLLLITLVVLAGVLSKGEPSEPAPRPTATSSP